MIDIYFKGMGFLSLVSCSEMCAGLKKNHFSCVFDNKKPDLLVGFPPQAQSIEQGYDTPMRYNRICTACGVISKTGK